MLHLRQKVNDKDSLYFDKDLAQFDKINAFERPILNSIK
jgi:hypothetical protein